MQAVIMAISLSRSICDRLGTPFLSDDETDKINTLDQLVAALNELMRREEHLLQHPLDAGQLTWRYSRPTRGREVLGPTFDLDMTEAAHYASIYYLPNRYVVGVLLAPDSWQGPIWLRILYNLQKEQLDDHIHYDSRYNDLGPAQRSMLRLFLGLYPKLSHLFEISTIQMLAV